MASNGIAPGSIEGPHRASRAKRDISRFTRDMWLRAVPSPAGMCPREGTETGGASPVASAARRVVPVASRKQGCFPDYSQRRICPALVHRVGCLSLPPPAHTSLKCHPGRGTSHYLALSLGVLLLPSLPNHTTAFSNLPFGWIQTRNVKANTHLILPHPPLAG